MTMNREGNTEEVVAAEQAAEGAAVGGTEGETIEIRIGFEAALDAFYPNWATEWPQAQIDAARFFYHAAVRDTGVFVNNAINNVSAGYKWIGEALVLPQAAAQEVETPAAPLAESAGTADAEDVQTLGDEMLRDIGVETPETVVSNHQGTAPGTAI